MIQERTDILTLERLSTFKVSPERWFHIKEHCHNLIGMEMPELLLAIDTQLQVLNSCRAGIKLVPHVMEGAQPNTRLILGESGDEDFTSFSDLFKLRKGPTMDRAQVIFEVQPLSGGFLAYREVRSLTDNELSIYQPIVEDIIQFNLNSKNQLSSESCKEESEAFVSRLKGKLPEGYGLYVYRSSVEFSSNGEIVTRYAIIPQVVEHQTPNNMCYATFQRKPEIGLVSLETIVPGSDTPMPPMPKPGLDARFANIWMKYAFIRNPN